MTAKLIILALLYAAAIVWSGAILAQDARDTVRLLRHGERIHVPQDGLRGTYPWQ